eukprot:CAMPEP_0117684530 /NCGR_PEP_ID=MMETSP0804-20121206/21151_1 /TAXON_ID=1074897 /ORGANISM="Tetraselmis astigmatica, Strain CCMP880" /LENGTH=224 /DNA_ID=CAMNT_0005495533 /DNA_START=1221 /DNA_END=1895 /DNA_ORIENTATION=+
MAGASMGGQASMSSIHSVPSEAREVHDYWFNGNPNKNNFKLWWMGSEENDAAIRQRFSGLVERAVRNGLGEEWEAHPTAACAKVIVLDQFTRQVHRASAKAFSGDELSRALVHKLAAETDYASGYSVHELSFAMVLPLMHSEDIEDHMLATRLIEDAKTRFAASGDQESVEQLNRPLSFLEDHTATLRRFGRYPSRNMALGRENTPEEAAYLSNEAKGWEKSQR